MPTGSTSSSSGTTASTSGGTQSQTIHGDSLVLWIVDVMFSIKGAITCQGILENGRGYATLTLPDADPDQRRALDRCKTYGFEPAPPDLPNTDLNSSLGLALGQPGGLYRRAAGGLSARLH